MNLKPMAFTIGACAASLIAGSGLYAWDGSPRADSCYAGNFGSPPSQKDKPLRIPCERCLVQVSKTESGWVETNSFSFVSVENGMLSIPSEMEGLRTKAIRPNAFAGNLEIKEVRIPSSVAWIGKRAFAGCTNLSSLVMLCGNHGSTLYDDGVGFIHSEAFMDCTSLTNVVFSDRLSAIYDWAFKGCRLLKEAALPLFVAHVSGSSFDDCESLRSGDLSLAMDVMVYAYRGCPSLEEFRVSSNNTTYVVYDGALYYKDLHALLRVPPQLDARIFSVRDGVKVICPFAFENSQIESVRLPDSLICIGEQAFSCCTNLDSVSIPKGVEEIGGHAFIGCVKLKEVFFMGDKLPKIGDRAFPPCVRMRLRGTKPCDMVEVIRSKEF